MARSRREAVDALRYNLKGAAGERAWENRAGGAPSSSRYLEPADVALGLKKAAPHRKKSPAPLTHDREKTGPYAPK